MGLAYGLEKGQCTPADLAKAIKMVPKNLEPYVTSEFPLSLGCSYPDGFVCPLSDIDIDIDIDSVG